MVRVFSYGYEDCLVALIKQGNSKASPTPCHSESSLDCLDTFNASFSKTKNRVSSYLAGLQKEKKKVALYGSGHVGHVFLNLFGVHSFLNL